MAIQDVHRGRSNRRKVEQRPRDRWACSEGERDIVPTGPRTNLEPGALAGSYTNTVSRGSSAGERASA